MTNTDFWNSIKDIILDGFSSEGLAKLDQYAADFTSGRLVYKRYTPQEQYGCSTGGYAHVVASLIAGAEVEADTVPEGFDNFKRQQQRAKMQAVRIEHWAKAITTDRIYLSDMHDENVIRTKHGVAVIDCDIRINMPECREGGKQVLLTEIDY